MLQSLADPGDGQTAFPGNALDAPPLPQLQDQIPTAEPLGCFLIHELLPHHSKPCMHMDMKRQHDEFTICVAK